MNTGFYYFLGGRVVCSGDSLLTSLPTGLIDGSTATSVQNKKTYLLTGSIWNEVSPIVSRYRYIAATGGIAAGTIIGLSGGFSYETGSSYNELFIYLNGCLQYKDSTTNSADNDYSQKNTTGVAFNYLLPSGACVEFVKYR